ncbi:MAG: DUF4832 domain-containing protein [Nanoarchaeota archaeon]|nr:DUF4832 domain-containing protein [Nanoarchaeota archaeon]
MKRNMLLVPFLAVLTLMIVGFASAALADNVSVELNGEPIDYRYDNDLVSFNGDVVPVTVFFTAGENSSDVKIRVSIYDGRDEVSVSTGRFNVVDGKKYKKLLALELPSDIDPESEELTLAVEIYDADHSTDDFDEDYQVSMQRDSYTLDVLSVDYSSQVEAGDIVPISVVVKNVGFSRMDDNYVVVSISALGVSSRGYAGDLIPVEDYKNYASGSEEDSVFKTVYLKIPSDAKTGVYEVRVAVYNDDTETIVTRLISVEGEEAIDSDDVTPLEGDDDSQVSPSVVALTVVLVIIFVVLLAVLVVLLTKKEKPIEEVETSYY